MSDVTSRLKNCGNNPGECKKLNDAKKRGRDIVAKAKLLSDPDVTGSRVQVVASA